MKLSLQRQIKYFLSSRNSIINRLNKKYIVSYELNNKGRIIICFIKFSFNLYI